MKFTNDARFSAAVIALTLKAAYSQTLDAQQQALLRQMLAQVQSTQASAPAQAAPAQPNLSPEQMQRMLQLLASQSAGQEPAAAATQPLPATPAVLKQGGQQISISPHKRESAFVKTKSNDLADALKAQAMSEALSLGTAAAAKKLATNVPYFGGMYSAAGGLLHRGAPKEQGFEIDFLRGTAAAATAKPEPFELMVPAAVAATTPGFEPVLVRVKLQEKDKVRIIAARKVRLQMKAASPFGGANQEHFDREILSSEVETIPAEVQRNADGSSLVRVTQQLAPGEYALLLQKPEPKAFRILDTVIDFRIAN